jgi:hypothetical protein
MIYYVTIECKFDFFYLLFYLLRKIKFRIIIIVNSTSSLFEAFSYKLIA